MGIDPIEALPLGSLLVGVRHGGVVQAAEMDHGDGEVGALRAGDPPLSVTVRAERDLDGDLLGHEMPEGEEEAAEDRLLDVLHAYRSVPQRLGLGLSGELVIAGPRVRVGF